MNLRLLAVIVVAVLFALAQLQLGVGRSPNDADTAATLSNRTTPAVAFADNGEDNEGDDDDDDDDDDNSGDDDDDDDDDNGDDENDDADNSDEDNDDADDENDDADNDDSDNEDDDEDNEDDDKDNEGDDDDDDDDDNEGGGDDDLDNAESSGGAPAGPAVAPTLPDLEAVGTSNGGDVVIALAGERLTLRVFPWMPSGITITVRKAQPSQFAVVPGRMVGDLMFTVEARDSLGNRLQSLPAEVNLALHYNDFEVTGMSESAITLDWLDPFDNQWKPTPKQFRQDSTNYIASSTTQLGVFVVHVP